MAGEQYQTKLKFLAREHESSTGLGRPVKVFTRFEPTCLNGQERRRRGRRRRRKHPRIIRVPVRALFVVYSVGRKATHDFT